LASYKRRSESDPRDGVESSLLDPKLRDLINYRLKAYRIALKDRTRICALDWEDNRLGVKCLRA